MSLKHVLENFQQHFIKIIEAILHFAYASIYKEEE